MWVNDIFATMESLTRTQEPLDPTIEDEFIKKLSVDGRECVVRILDTATQGDYHTTLVSFRLNTEKRIGIRLQSGATGFRESFKAKKGRNY
jgi:hypothetical protein